MAAPTHAAPIRKKRNFKSLHLDVSAPAPAPPTEPAPTRLAPAPGPAKKKRPPPMTLAAPKITPNGTAADPDGVLTVTTAAADPVTSTASATRMTYHNKLSNTLARLDMNSEPKFHDLHNEDLEDLKELGQGNGGSVKKVKHKPTGTIMAKKVPSPSLSRIVHTANTPRTRSQIVLIDAKPSVRKQILRELQIMHDCNSPYIISFYGAFIADPNICICMEYMDKGSLDGIYKKIGPIDIEVVGKVALAVLEGLTYLYDVHRIIHRGARASPYTYTDVNCC